MYRFDDALQAEVDKYKMMELRKAPPAEQAALAIDCLSTCCLGALACLQGVHCTAFLFWVFLFIFFWAAVDRLAMPFVCIDPLAAAPAVLPSHFLLLQVPGNQ